MPITHRKNFLIPLAVMEKKQEHAPGHVEVTEFISPAATWNLFGALILISAITDLCGSTSPSNETIQLPDVKSITSALS